MACPSKTAFTVRIPRDNDSPVWQTTTYLEELRASFYTTLKRPSDPTMIKSIPDFRE